MKNTTLEGMKRNARRLLHTLEQYWNWEQSLAPMSLYVLQGVVQNWFVLVKE